MDPVIRVGEGILRAGRHATTISPDRSRVYSFDLEGRPLSWFDRGRVFKRSLGGDVFGRERRSGERHYEHFSGKDAAALYREVHDSLDELPRTRLPAALADRLARIVDWTPERLLAEAVRYHAAYRPIGILPPDQYLSIVLQATEGCSWNRCSYCNFYQDRPFRVRSAADFRKHAERVRQLLGLGAGLRRSIFLADGNALTLSNRRLRPFLDCARELFPERHLHGFVDVFSGERKPVEDWKELRGAGLRRVYVGVETGDDALLRWVGKPGAARDAEGLIGDLKRAGLQVSTILMVGVGGMRFGEDHVRHTLRLFARLGLSAGDIVYLAPFRLHPESDYARRAEGEGVQPLSPEAESLQYRRLRDCIRELHPAVPVVRYDLREFVY